MEVLHMPRFKQAPQHPSQVMLFGLSVDESVPADSDVRVLSEVMDLLDWSGIVSSYCDDGCPAYPPQVMTKILAYAYSNGVRSSRKIESLVENDKRYIWLAGGLRPDFHTLARFRRDKWEYLVGLFDDSARICAQFGLVLLNAVSIDGSKVRSSASGKAVYDEKRIERERARIESVLREAEEVDREEDAEFGSSNGRRLPECLSKIEDRKARLEKAAEFVMRSKRKMVVTSDAESRVMKTRNGTAPCYNLQAAVDVESQVIVAMDVVQNEVDHSLLSPMMEKVEQNMGLSADVFLADSGYCDEDTLLALESSGRDALMPPLGSPKEKRESLFRSESFVHNEERDVLICPAGRELCFKRIHRKNHGTYRVYAAKGCQSCSFYRQCAGGKSSRAVERSVAYRMRARMRERLKSSPGKEKYALRSQSVEPVFGQVKSNRCINRLLLRGLNGAKAELALAFMAHNVSKCVKLLTRRAVANHSDVRRAFLARVRVPISRQIATIKEYWRRRLTHVRILSVAAR
jgi:transposase